jgi:hypothetical protein
VRAPVNLEDPMLTFSPSKSIRSPLRLSLAVLVVAGVIGVAAPAQAIVSITAFTLDSQPGDYIGQGQTVTMTSSNATISATGDTSSIDVTAFSGSHSLEAVLAPPTGGALTTGTTYPTTKLGDASNAALDVGGDGRGCSTSTGTMTVNQISVDGLGQIDALAVTYEQHCESATPALFGELRYQSSTGFKADDVDHTSLDFGSQTLSTASVPHTVTITNSGSSNLVLGTAAVTGTASSDYSLPTDTCSGATIAATATCSLDVVFTPSTAGTRTASVTLTANTARGGIEITLTGTGAKLASTVTIKTSDSKVNLNGSVRVTAQLAQFHDTTSKQVKIYAQPYGSGKKLIKSGNVDSSGNLKVKISLTRRTAFTATFGGDAVYDVDSSPAKTVWVFPIVKGTMIHTYGRSGKYHLYHYTSKCPKAHRGCPTVAMKVSPNHRGKTVYVALQVYTGGSWRTAVKTKTRLNSKSEQAIAFIYRNSGVIGYKTRVDVRFPGDADHLARSSAWSYFRVTT